MASITDTHKVINLLQKKGFSKDQAEGIVEVFSELDFSTLATKGDIAAVQVAIAELRGTQKVLMAINIGIALGIFSLFLSA